MSVPSIKKNIAANFTGSLWQGLMGIIFVPFYIKLMGAESYGLIGIFVSLQAMMALLDLGLSASLTREMARLSVLSDTAQEMRNLLRSLETVYWSVACCIGVGVVVSAPFIAHQWVKPGTLSADVIEQAVRIMGFAMALQWPSSLYSGGLIGLQRQVLLNIVNSTMSTVRGVGALLVLWLIAPTIQIFFLWQIIVSILSTGFLFFYLWRALPSASGGACFQKKLIRGVWRFAAGMTGITVVTVILTQLDKIILSKLLTLEIFGYYAFAGVIASALYRIIGPVWQATYPKLTELVAIGDEGRLKEVYHKACQLMSVLLLPVAVFLAFFSHEIILLWTRDPVITERTYLLVSILVCGTALNGLMNIPYALQLAHGWTRLGFSINLTAAIVLVPLIFYLTIHYGAVGGASAWFLLNLGYVIFGIGLMHRQLIPTEKKAWYVNDVLKPLLLVLAVVLGARLTIHGKMTSLTTIILLSCVLLVSLLASAMTVPWMRGWLMNRLLVLRRGS